MKKIFIQGALPFASLALGVMMLIPYGAFAITVKSKLSQPVKASAHTVRPLDKQIKICGVTLPNIPELKTVRLREQSDSYGACTFDSGYTLGEVSSHTEYLKKSSPGSEGAVGAGGEDRVMNLRAYFSAGSGSGIPEGGGLKLLKKIVSNKKTIGAIFITDFSGSFDPASDGADVLISGYRLIDDNHALRVDRHFDLGMDTQFHSALAQSARNHNVNLSNWLAGQLDVTLPKAESQKLHAVAVAAVNRLMNSKTFKSQLNDMTVLLQKAY